MRDDDRLLDLPDPEFGSGVVGVCDVCGTRQAVVILSKERYKLCVLDFLNKTWLTTEKKPGAPAPLYRSDRVWFASPEAPSGKAQGILLSPTKIVKHPVVLVTPDVYGITTTMLDGAIRFAREGFEVLLPDLVKSDLGGPSTHLSMRAGARFRGGVPVDSRRVAPLVRLYGDALAYLRGREMVDPAKSGLFGASYGGSLAVALAAQETKLAAVALAYPQPVRPPTLPALVTAPTLVVAAAADRGTDRLRSQFASTEPGREFVVVPGVGRDFLSRDLAAYQVGPAEEAWTRIVGFLKQRLAPAAPRPPAPPVVPAAAPVAKPAVPAASA